tara:strand:- start:1038 stop:1310 length:273 start_codon:yes stop_codon:yes gene_type:complete
MKRVYQKLERQLKALGNSRRLEILAYLKKNKNGVVSDIAEAVGIRIEATSQHLRILKDTGIVEYTKRGRYASYRISLHQEEPVKSVLKVI